MLKKNPQKRLESLSPRQREVLERFCQGMLYKDIAAHLVIEETTVKSHMNAIYKKLGLYHLTRDERVFQIRSVFCPLLDEAEADEVLDYEIVEVEPDPEPVTPEEDRMLIYDQEALLALRNPGASLSSPPKRKSLMKRLFITVFLLMVLGLAIFGGLTLLWQSLKPAGAGGISLPFAAPPAYEIGEWHQEGDLWIRLADYEVTRGLIRLDFEVWNQSDRDLYFSWSAQGSFSMVDNKKNRYEVFETNTYEETVEQGERLVFDGYGYETVSFVDDPLYLPGVTDLYITMEYLSEFKKATFHIPVGK